MLSRAASDRRRARRAAGRGDAAAVVRQPCLVGADVGFSAGPDRGGLAAGGGARVRPAAAAPLGRRRGRRGCLAYQLWRILPFTPLARKEMRFARGSRRERRDLSRRQRPDGEPGARAGAGADRGDRSRRAAADGDRSRLVRRDAAGAGVLSDRADGAARRLLRHGLRHPARGSRGARSCGSTEDETPAVLAELRDPRRRGVQLRRAAPAAAGARGRHRGARRADPLRRPLRAGLRPAARDDGRLQRRRLVRHRAAVQAATGATSIRGSAAASTRASTPTARCSAARSTSSTSPTTWRSRASASGRTSAPTTSR